MNSPNTERFENNWFPITHTQTHKPPDLVTALTSRPKFILSSSTNTCMDQRSTNTTAYQSTFPQPRRGDVLEPCQSSTAFPSSDPIPIRPFPVSSADQWLLYRMNQVRLFTDLNVPRAADISTPSSASSSSSCMALTPTSLRHDGQIDPTMINVAEDVDMFSDEIQRPRSGFDFVGPKDELPAQMESRTRFSHTSIDSWAPVHTTHPFPHMRQPQPTSDPCFYEVSNDASDGWLDEWEYPNSMHSTHSQLHHDFHPSQMRQYDSHDGLQQQLYSYPKDTMRSYTPFTYSPVWQPPTEPKFSQPVSVSHSASSFSHLSSNSPPIAPAGNHHQPLLCLYQPQPIRPIPIIPLSNLSSLASTDFSTSTPNDTGSRSSYDDYASQKPHRSTLSQCHSRTKPDLLSPLSLLCQPVPDSIRYQIKAIDGIDEHQTTSNLATPLMEDTFLDSTPYHDMLTETGGLFCPCGCMGSTIHQL